MKATDIEDAISKLAEEPFDAAEFPFRLLEAFGNKETTLKRLRSGSSNASDVEGGVLQRSNIHIAVCDAGAVSETLKKLRSSPATLKAKAKFVLATDGDMLEVEELSTGDAVACKYTDLPRHFGLLLPLAGISTVRQIKDNPIDIRATNRLNKLYLELLKENPDWESEARRADLNQFMARLIFCFFAEDTGIFIGDSLFSSTLEQFTASDSSNTHEVIAELFRAMDTKIADRAKAKIRPFADSFPYVNGGLFTKRNEVPRFSRIARSYLLNAGSLNWREINPDIFGSMIQAVADEDERGELGMHYTSVPNILKVLDPLFLDDLREKLEEAGDNKRKLQNLRKRLARIRVFDPACGSGNFLVIAYRQMREIERRIIIRLQGGKGTDEELLDLVRFHGERSVIPLTNFYGIEIKSFAAEIARLALLIAEFQSDVNYIGQKEARDMVLPLHDTGRIKTGNALRLDWLEVCPPQKPASAVEEDLGGPTGRLALELSPEPEGETYLCGNPPYIGDKLQTRQHKGELRLLKVGRQDVRAIDYIVGWFWKASDYIKQGGRFAFVSTNSICQGVQVPLVWPRILDNGQCIFFAHEGFLWGNNAARNAQVTCVIAGVSSFSERRKFIFSGDVRKEVANINPYLTAGSNVIVERASAPISGIATMFGGNIPRDQGNLLLTSADVDALLDEYPQAKVLVKPILGSNEFINGLSRYCLWISDAQAKLAQSIPPIADRLERIREYREHGSDRGRAGVDTPYKFERTIIGQQQTIVVPSVSSERRQYLPCGLLAPDVRVSNLALAIYDAPLWNMAVIASRLHLVWVATICGKLETRYRYSNTLGWNTFPVPPLTENQKAELTRCAEDILLAREAHFPATIADLYDPEKMPDNLRAAHDKNDETLERIYIGRRFKNDTERLEKLFDMYTKMTAKADATAKPKKAKKGAA